MPRDDSPTLYPLFLKLDGRFVVVIGAGPVAERKVASLLDAHARVRVVAPAATAWLRGQAAQGRLEWCTKEFDEGDLDGARLVVAATDDPRVQQAVFVAGEARGCLWSRSTTRPMLRRTPGPWSIGGRSLSRCRPRARRRP